jgi:hypothetical protein
MTEKEYALMHLIDIMIYGYKAKFPLDFRNTLLYC